MTIALVVAGAVVGWLAAVVCVLGLCRAAAEGDRMRAEELAENARGRSNPTDVEDAERTSAKGCPDPLCEDGEYKDDSMSVLGVPGGRVGYALCSTCDGGALRALSDDCPPHGIPRPEELAALYGHPSARQS